MMYTDTLSALMTEQYDYVVASTDIHNYCKYTVIIGGVPREMFAFNRQSYELSSILLIMSHTLHCTKPEEVRQHHVQRCCGGRGRYYSDHTHITFYCC